MRLARTKARYSMRGLAEAASAASEGLPAIDPPLGHSMLSFIESGQQARLDAEIAVRLARVLGVSVEWLVTGIDAAKGTP